MCLPLTTVLIVKAKLRGGAGKGWLVKGLLAPGASCMLGKHSTAEPHVQVPKEHGCYFLFNI